MLAKLFKAATYSDGWSSFQDDLILVTDRITALEYTERFTKVGEFSLTLPFSADVFKIFMREGIINGTVYIDSRWFWIQSIAYDYKTITLTGKDCKGMLSTRVTEYGTAQSAAEQGYDIAEGTTKECIEHYVSYNAMSPTNADRRLPIVEVNGVDGLSTDSYMTHLEVLSDVVELLCIDADIGYTVRGRFRNEQSSGFVLTTLKGVDRSHEQSDRPRVIFSVSHGTVLSMSCEHGVDDMVNTIYATDTNDTVTIVHRGGNSHASGLLRRECNISVGLSSTTETSAYYNKYVLNEVADNVETHSYSVAVRAADYGTAYSLGDYVSVLDDYTKNMEKKQITEVSRSYAAGQMSVGVTLGAPKQKPFQRLNNDLISGTARRR